MGKKRSILNDPRTKVIKEIINTCRCQWMMAADNEVKVSLYSGLEHRFWAKLVGIKSTLYCQPCGLGEIILTVLCLSFILILNENENSIIEDKIICKRL